MEEILNIKNLNVSYRSKENSQYVLNGINLMVSKGEIITFLGETGCGKSTLAKSLISLVPNAEILSCERYQLQLKNGTKINLEYSCPEDFMKIRGKEIGLVYQEAVSHLDPTMVCGKQLMESLKQYKATAQEAEIIDVLKSLGFPEAQHIMKAYPHQLSGGECQRVLLAMATVQEPEVLIVDEPTSSLDRPNENLVITYLKKLNQEKGITILFITHDISIAMKLSDRILVMQEGVITDDFHPARRQNLNEYTQFLIEKGELLSKESIAHSKENITPILTAIDLNFEYASSAGRSFLFNKKNHIIKNISFQLNTLDILGVFGVSGSGKTTLARLICGLEKPKSGKLTTDENTGVQMVFQNPNDSLDPLQKVGEAIKEVLGRHEKNPTKDIVLGLLAQVQLPPEIYHKRPRNLSGGEKQRVCIARALASKPKILIFDEATSALDAPVKTEILELLIKLKEELSLTYIFITHDLSVIKFITNRIIVMNDGEIVEQGNTPTIVNNPTHPATKALLLQK